MKGRDTHFNHIFQYAIFFVYTILLFMFSICFHIFVKIKAFKSNQIKFILAIKKNNITQKERINKHYTWQGSPIETIRLISFGLP